MSITLSNDMHSTTQLVKVLPSHRLRVMGGQPRICSNSKLAYGTSVDLSLTLNRKSISTRFPLDVVFRDQYHVAGLPARWGSSQHCAAATLATSGHSVTKIGVTAREYQATPASSNYTL